MSVTVAQRDCFFGTDFVEYGTRVAMNRALKIMQRFINIVFLGVRIVLIQDDSLARRTSANAIRITLRLSVPTGFIENMKTRRINLGDVISIGP